MRPVEIPASATQRSVWDFPRPPALLPDGREVVITFAGTTVAETTRALTVLETSHPPTWYLPRDDIVSGALRPSAGTSFCEWKGAAAYLDVVVGDAVALEAGWYYPDPSAGFDALRDHVAFYAGRVDRVTVDGETVIPQPGGFYGGWITSDVVGPFKGTPGTSVW